MSVSVWEAIFMLVVLKIPLIYLAAVVWWAVRAQPEAPGGGDEVGVLTPLTPCGWSDWQRGRARHVGRRPIRPAGGRVAAPARLS
ncbi:MAG TPA: hypothetical protein VMK83_03410 [Gaiellaceae bacterium]|nr:hypothetical protein [Gaiellaceae bacterium]